MRLLPFLILPLAACAASATERGARNGRLDPEAGLNRELAGLVRGSTTSCLPSYPRNLGTRAYGSTIVYVQNRGLKYASTTTGGCEHIARGDALITRSTIGRVCRGDIATTFDPVSRIQTGSCAFGDFTEYRRP